MFQAEKEDQTKMINFMKFSWLYFGISAGLVVASILFISTWGLRPAIDFVGGALIEVQFPEVENLGDSVSTENISNLVSQVENVQVSSVQFSSSNESFVIRSNTISEDQKSQVLSNLSDEISQVQEVRFESVGPTLGRELLVKTGIAVLIAAFVIMTYIVYQFNDKLYGFATIIAMVHDVIVLAGAFALFGYLFGVEVDVLFVTAMLITLSFSVHDTIVVFDRVRESIRRYKGSSLDQIINKAITETLPRSLNNSLTTIIMLTALAVLGGETIRWFVIALLVGIISGTYSSPFLSAPLLLFFKSRQRKK